MYGGTNGIIIPIILLVLLGIVVVIGARYARRAGHLQSRNSRIAAAVVVAIIAALIWVAPALFILG